MHFYWIVKNVSSLFPRSVQTVAIYTAHRRPAKSSLWFKIERISCCETSTLLLYFEVLGQRVTTDVSPMTRKPKNIFFPIKFLQLKLAPRLKDQEVPFYQCNMVRCFHLTSDTFSFTADHSLGPGRCGGGCRLQRQQWRILRLSRPGQLQLRLQHHRPLRRHRQPCAGEPTRRPHRGLVLDPATGRSAADGDLLGGREVRI